MYPMIPAKLADVTEEGLVLIRVLSITAKRTTPVSGCTRLSITCFTKSEVLVKFCQGMNS